MKELTDSPILGFVVYADSHPAENRNKTAYVIKERLRGGRNQIRETHSMGAIVPHQDTLGMTSNDVKEVKHSDRSVFVSRHIFVKQNGTKYIHHNHVVAGAQKRTYDLNMEEEKALERAERRYLKEKNPSVWRKIKNKIKGGKE